MAGVEGVAGGCSYRFRCRRVQVCRRWVDLEDHWQELEGEAGHLLDILHNQLVAGVGEKVRSDDTT